MLWNNVYQQPYHMYADCYDEFECANDTIIVNEQRLNCHDRGSCADGMINNIGYGSDAVWTACYGARSCQSLSLLTGTVDDRGQAWGYLSLAWIDTVTVSPLKCYGEASCYKIKNATSDTIYCFGFRSCLELEGIDNKYIGATGVLSLENSIDGKMNF